MADHEAKIDLGIEGLGPAEHIGRGGFADVYRAEQLSLRRTVAVKVLRAQASDEETEARFQRECHAIGAVSDHPHIVGVHEGGFTRNGRAYLVMEYLPGGSLLDRLREHGPMPVEEIVETTMKIGRAISVAHQAGVLHRDVKPANIMISAYGEPALGDFGIARIEGGHQTATGLVTASFAHAAPEVLEGQTPSAAADIYSLGSTMFELLTGGAPYYSPNDESVWPLMKRILSEPMPSPESVGMSRQLGRIFERATARSPGERYPDAELMAQDLELVAADPVALLLYRPIEPGLDRTAPADETVVESTGAGGKVVSPSGLLASRQVGVGQPGGPPPGSKPDLTSLRRASTELLPTTGNEDAAAAGPPHLLEPDDQPSSPGPPITVGGGGGGRRSLGIVLAGLGAMAVAAIGGLLLLAWLGDPGSSDESQGSPEAGIELLVPGADEGPIRAGQPLALNLAEQPAGAEFRLIVDGEPVSSPNAQLPMFIPTDGRHSVAVEVTGDTGPQLSRTVQFYATGAEAPTGYRANLASVAGAGAGWDTAIRIYDQLEADGHEGLQLLSNDDYPDMTPGYWTIFVPGFGEDAEAAEAYCQRFELAVPDRCYASFFDPSSATRS